MEWDKSNFIINHCRIIIRLKKSQQLIRAGVRIANRSLRAVKCHIIINNGLLDHCVVLNVV